MWSYKSDIFPTAISMSSFNLNTMVRVALVVSLPLYVELILCVFILPERLTFARGMACNLFDAAKF